MKTSQKINSEIGVEVMEIAEHAPVVAVETPAAEGTTEREHEAAPGADGGGVIREQKLTLFRYMEGIIGRLREAGKERTAETYTSALNSFRRFRSNTDINLTDITPDIIRDYQTSLANRGVSTNTSSFYIRVLRAAFNKAIDDELIEARNPFKRVYTGVDKTPKRALSVDTIKKIRHLDLNDAPAVAYARDIFMLSFYLRGMSFVDMAYLKTADLKDGYITYRRHKTGQQLTIKWTPEMQAILDRYYPTFSTSEGATPNRVGEYLLPIMEGSVKSRRGRSASTERSRYKNVGFNVNHNLKTVARKLGLTTSLTLYVARHSWATAAKTNGIPINVISEAMGHNSETTTRIYLTSLDNTEIDAANDKILSSLL